MTIPVALMMGTSAAEEFGSKDPYSLYGKDVLKELKEEGSRLLAWSKDLQNSARKSGTKLQIVPKVEHVEKVHRIENKLEPIEDTSYEQPLVTTNTFGFQETPTDTPSAREPFYYPPDMSHSDISRAILNLGGVPSNHSRFGSLHALEGNASKDGHSCTHVSPQYAHLLTVLQHKYTTLLRKFEEVNEQRMSYIEGIREYQAKLDNARALLQMHQKEFERVAKRAHELEEENEGLLLQLQELSHRSTKPLEQAERPSERSEYDEESTEEDESTLRSSARERVVYDEAREEENREKICNLEEELNEKQKESEHLYKSLELLRADMKKKMNELENGIQALYMHMLNATEIIRTAVEDEDDQNAIKKAFTVYDVLKNVVEAVEKLHVEPALESLEDDLRLGFRKQMNEMMEAFAELGLKEPECRGCKEYKEKLKRVEADRSRLKNMINRASGRGKDLAYKLKDLVYMEKLKKPVKVQLLKVGIFRKKFVDASIFIKGKTLVIKRKMGIKVKLSDIIRVNFGYESLGYSKYVNMIGGYPWNFFTICTKKGYLHFYNPVDSTLELWVAGINHISGQSLANTEKDVRIRRTRMKILYHAKRKGIPLHKLWIKAIRKAAAAGAYDT